MASDLEKSLQDKGIDLDIVYETEGPSRERILAQAQLNSSIYTAMNVAREYGKKKLSVVVSPFGKGKQAHYTFNAGLEVLQNPELTLHGFLLADEGEPIDAESEIKRYLKFINEKYLEDLRIKPGDKERTDGTPRPARGSILPVKEYSIDGVKLERLHTKDGHRIGDNEAAVSTDVTVTLSSKPIGRVYTQETEYFEREILPLFKGNHNGHDISKAIYTFISALRKRFPTDTALNYHEGQLRQTELALDDLLYLATSVYKLPLVKEDITGKVGDEEALEIIGKRLFKGKSPSKITTSSLLNMIFSYRESAATVLEKERKGEPLVLDIKNANLVYTK